MTDPRCKNVIDYAAEARASVAYLRARPSEPEASYRALEVQRNAVRRDLGGRYPTQEFIEEEDDDTNALRPAWYAAVRAAETLAAQWEGANFYIPTRAAIGRGAPFVHDPKPSAETTLATATFPIFYHELSEPLDPPDERITVTTGGGNNVRLHAVHRPDQLQSRIYLCNVGETAMTDVDLCVILVDMAIGEEWSRDKGLEEQLAWTSLEPGEGVLVSMIDHRISDGYGRYYLAFTVPMNGPCALVASDFQLDPRMYEVGDAPVWGDFGPAKAP